MVKIKETLLAKHLATKVELTEKKDKQKEKWARRSVFEERKIALEEQRRDEKTAEEDRFMVMNPEGMDVMTREFWEMKRMEIMCWRRVELQNLMAGGGGFAFGNGGFGGFGGGFAFGNGGGGVGFGGGGGGLGFGGGGGDASANGGEDASAGGVDASANDGDGGDASAIPNDDEDGARAMAGGGTDDLSCVCFDHMFSFCLIAYS
ncbi:keratin, type II cytoskeletal 1-like [Triticum aestivum]|uniref:keratin, type II cytoskeletal 1-like n=1 Tax=Triticum aestivum TaxID=4565 RepID=UPI001D01FB25|nr:keratin, type II cytoskeletal 1-like [Triticum aestivum]